MSSVKFLGRVAPTCAEYWRCEFGQCHAPVSPSPLALLRGQLAQVSGFWLLKRASASGIVQGTWDSERPVSSCSV